MRTTITTRKESRYRHFNMAVQLGDQRTLPCRFLYIGTEPVHFHMLSEELGQGVSFPGLSDALVYGRRPAFDGAGPQEIYLDLGKWTKQEVAQIRELKKLDKTGHLLVIANARGLAQADIRDMQATGILDELVDFRVETALLPDKIRFLRQVGSQIAGGDRPGHIGRTLPLNRGAEWVKRVIDLLIASTLLLLVSPLLAMIAVVVGLESNGPVFCGTYRAGRGYRVFKLWTFRTMKVGADRMLQSIAHLNTFNNFGHAPHGFPGGRDPRMTRVGRFLRQWGLDRLPSLWNVILGDLSLVGNRPLPLYEASALTADEWVERFVAPCGLTGLWALAGRQEGASAVAERLRADLRYARHACLVLDLKIMGMTLYANFTYWVKKLVGEPVGKAGAGQGSGAPLTLAGES